MSDAQGSLTSDLDTVTHTNNGPNTVTFTSNEILDKTLFSGRTIGEVSFLHPPNNPTVRLTAQTLLMPAVKEIFADATPGNM